MKSWRQVRPEGLNGDLLWVGYMDGKEVSSPSVQGKPSRRGFPWLQRGWAEKDTGTEKAGVGQT